ncbi:PepSY domain-containing protein [Nocardiopsis sp. MG754419]|uniref:PepSY domain-containing protein n=1 Tax=Nocardiopsis sp. MG754419 TaxID=2259865 RepID=UPI001BA6CBE0|nr:hypothetical protein [Nocardiopsis sp. MG754419]MBR8741203.1 hypothetical protein [Nocardiopsis sp. MG754419]
MNRRTTIILCCAGAGLLVVGVGGYLEIRDTAHPLESIRLESATEIAPATPAAGTAPRTGTVEGLEQLTGRLGAGEDVDDWYVAGVEVDFGPEEWLLTDPTLEDFDADGTVAPVLDELRALEGTEVTLGVRYDDDDDDDDDRDDADVFTIGDVTYRDPEGGTPPWRSDGARETTDRGAVARSAEEAVGEGAQALEVDHSDEDGWQGWEVEVRDADGVEHDVLLDAAGDVVDVRVDD